MAQELARINGCGSCWCRISTDPLIRVGGQSRLMEGTLGKGHVQSFFQPWVKRGVGSWFNHGLSMLSL